MSSRELFTDLSPSIAELSSKSSSMMVTALNRFSLGPGRRKIFIMLICFLGAGKGWELPGGTKSTTRHVVSSLSPRLRKASCESNKHFNRAYSLEKIGTHKTPDITAQQSSVVFQQG